MVKQNHITIEINKTTMVKQNHITIGIKKNISQSELRKQQKR